MTRVKKNRIKYLSCQEQAEVDALEAEIGCISEYIFNHLSEDNEEKTRLIRQKEKRILDIQGVSPLDVNSDFRR